MGRRPARCGRAQQRGRSSSAGSATGCCWSVPPTCYAPNRPAGPVSVRGGAASGTALPPHYSQRYRWCPDLGLLDGDTLARRSREQKRRRLSSAPQRPAPPSAEPAGRTTASPTDSALRVGPQAVNRVSTCPPRWSNQAGRRLAGAAAVSEPRPNRLLGDGVADLPDRPEPAPPRRRRLWCGLRHHPARSMPAEANRGDDPPTLRGGALDPRRRRQPWHPYRRRPRTDPDPAEGGRRGKGVVSGLRGWRTSSSGDEPAAPSPVLRARATHRAPGDQRGGPVPAVTEPLYSTPITAQFGDRRMHEVTDDDACTARRGEYPALCGVMFIAAPMIVEAGAPCPDCAAILTARRAAADTAARQRPRHRRRGRLWQLLHPWQRRPA